MSEKYTDATHESIKRVLENAEEHKMIAVGLNVPLVRAMIDEIERLRKYAPMGKEFDWYPLSSNPESEPE